MTTVNKRSSGDRPKPATVNESGYIQGPLKWAIAFTASLGAILEVIDSSIVNVALTDIQATLGATVSEVGWVVTGYAIANVVLIPLSAWLGDYFGRKTYFIFSLIGFTISSVLCGISFNLPMLIAARILQGLCGGSIGIALLTTLLDRRQAFHRAILLAKLTPYDPETNQRLDLLNGALQSQGIDAATAQQQALALLSQTVDTQAAVLSYADCFRVVGIGFLCSLPLLLFLGKGGSGAKAPVGH